MLLKRIEDYQGIYLACGATDLRKSVDGLANVVRQDFQMDPFENALFLFCNKSRNRLKVLCWDKNGFWLGFKRLDGQGAKFKWPCNASATRNIEITHLQMLLEGMSIDPPKGFGEISAKDF